MIQYKSWFHDFKEEGGQVILVDKNAYKILSLGIINVILFDGCCREFHHVRYIPDFKRYLIIVGTLNSNALVVKIEGGTIKVIRGILTLIKGGINNGLYVLDGHIVDQTITMDASTMMSIR